MVKSSTPREGSSKNENSAAAENVVQARDIKGNVHLHSEGKHFDDPATHELSSAVRELSETQRNRNDAFGAVIKYQELVITLHFLSRKLQGATQELYSEREILREQLRVARNEIRQLRSIQRELDSTQERLSATERLQSDTKKRLDEAMSQLEVAERVRDEAIRQSEKAQRESIGTEASVATLLATTEPEIPNEKLSGGQLAGLADLMGDHDQRSARTILGEIDSLLEFEAEHLNSLKRQLGQGSTTAEPPKGKTIRSLSSSRFPEVWGHKIQPRNKNFTGREDILAQLHERLAAGKAEATPCALHGIGGSGKTQIAAEYAYRYRHEYDLVWWISADQPVLVRSSLAGLSSHLRLRSASEAGIEDAAVSVLNSLRRGKPYAHWLLIFDNADQTEDLDDLILRGPGHVLITSRNTRWQSVATAFSVDIFDRAESVRFLTEALFGRLSKPQAYQLAQELGDLPLALEQARGLLADTGMSPDTYLHLLKEQTARLLAEGKPSEYPVSMTAAWALSVSKLRERMPEAVELLRYCAFIEDKLIPVDLFQRRQNPLSRLRSIPEDQIALYGSIREIRRFGLAQVVDSQQSIKVHPLIQALLRDELSPEERAQYKNEVEQLLTEGCSNLADATE